MNILNHLFSSFYVLIDIGGSGIKLATYKNGEISGIEKRNDIDSFDGFVRMIKDRSAGERLGGIAISTAGFVDAEAGRVLTCRCAPYLQGELVQRLKDSFSPLTKVFVMNDGEAHARALLLPKRNVKFGAIHLAFGTSVSLGVINERKEIVRTCGGENWDVGNFRIRTARTLKTPEKAYEVWYELGSAGLKELEQTREIPDPYRHFGNRLGNFLIDLAVVFRPKTIGLSGGIIMSQGQAILEGVKEEWQARDFSGPVCSDRVEFALLTDSMAVMEGLTTVF